MTDTQIPLKANKYNYGYPAKAQRKTLLQSDLSIVGLALAVFVVIGLDLWKHPNRAIVVIGGAALCVLVVMTFGHRKRIGPMLPEKEHIEHFTSDGSWARGLTVAGYVGSVLQYQNGMLTLLSSKAAAAQEQGSPSDEAQRTLFNFPITDVKSVKIGLDYHLVLYTGHGAYNIACDRASSQDHISRLKIAKRWQAIFWQHGIPTSKVHKHVGFILFAITASLIVLVYIYCFYVVPTPRT